MSYVWAPYLFFSGIGSIIFGAFGAFAQRSVKRFLAFTSMNNFGFILILISLLQLNSFQYALLFLNSYVVGTTLLIFIINFCKPVTTFRKFYSFSDLATVAALYPLIG
jgi:formate hydrogenlyase subunit 3/multisubunit Na+/H+ antiporter MnhD subunit